MPFFFAASSYISQTLSGIGSKFSWTAQEPQATEWCSRRKNSQFGRDADR
jgi:hypothetical protein